MTSLAVSIVFPPSEVSVELRLLDSDGVLKLVDFGLARTWDPDPISTGLTTEGAILGTPYYMSAEQILGRDATVEGRWTQAQLAPADAAAPDAAVADAPTADSLARDATVDVVISPGDAAAGR